MQQPATKKQKQYRETRIKKMRLCSVLRKELAPGNVPYARNPPSKIAAKKANLDLEDSNLDVKMVAV
jgi:hypothetical protein